jgi:hypothetical protein
MLITRFLTVSLVVACLAGVTPSADVTTLAGKKVSGTPTKFENGVVTIRDGTNEVALPAKDLAVIDFGVRPGPPEGTKYDDVTVTDGSLLRTVGFKIKGKAFEMVPVTGPAGVPPPIVALPLNKVFHVLRGADQVKARDDWAKLVAGRGKRDLFVSRSAEGVLSPLPGTVLDGTAEGESVTFEREDGQVATLPLRRATGGIVFNQPPVGVVPPTLCTVSDAFGNVLYAQSVEFADGGLKVKTIHGVAVTYPSLAAVSKFDFAQGNVVALADLVPAVTAPPAVPGEPYYTFLTDKSQDNGPIRLGGVTYARGVWVAPDVSLTYKLPAEVREFKAVVGVDDGIEVPSSAVKLTIEGDGRVLFAGLVNRADKPRELVLDVKGVRELRVIVEQATRFTGNQVTLADAKLQK